SDEKTQLTPAGNWDNRLVCRKGSTLRAICDHYVGAEYPRKRKDKRESWRLEGTSFENRMAHNGNPFHIHGSCHHFFCTSSLSLMSRLPQLWPQSPNGKNFPYSTLIPVLVTRK